jgi:putative two-component system response regulator
VALADAFDALTHGRPYAAPCSDEHAVEAIRARRGTQFDPDLTDTFLDLISELKIRQPDLHTYLGESSRESLFHQARHNIRAMLEGEISAASRTPAVSETMH